MVSMSAAMERVVEARFSLADPAGTEMAAEVLMLIERFEQGRLPAELQAKVAAYLLEA